MWFGSEEEKPDMTNKWVTNLILLIALVGASIVAFQSLKEEPEVVKGIEVTNFKLSDFDEIELNFRSKAKVHFKIIENQDINLVHARVFLLNKILSVIKSGLSILGVNAPETM